MLNLTELHSHLLSIHYGLESALCIMKKPWDTVLMELRTQGAGGADIPTNGTAVEKHWK